MIAEGDERVGPLLADAQALFAQLVGFVPKQRFGVDVLQRRSTPLGQRGGEPVRGPTQVAVTRGLRSGRGERPEPGEVEQLLVEFEQVATAFGADRDVVAERAPDPQDVGLQGAFRAPLIVRPQPAAQFLDRHHRVRAQQQTGQHDERPAAAQGHRQPVRRDLCGPQHAKVECHVAHSVGNPDKRHVIPAVA